MSKNRKWLIFGIAASVAVTPLLIISALILVITALTATDKTYTDSISDYGKYDRDVQIVLDEDFDVFMPENNGGLNITDYTYEYYNSVGESARFANFSIYAEISYGADDFESERARIASYGGQTFSDAENGREYILVKGSTTDIEFYFSERVLDGYIYDFEIAVLSESDLTVKYLTARYRGGMRECANVSELIRPIYDIIENSEE